MIANNFSLKFVQPYREINQHYPTNKSGIIVSCITSHYFLQFSVRIMYNSIIFVNFWFNIPESFKVRIIRCSKGVWKVLLRNLYDLFNTIVFSIPFDNQILFSHYISFVYCINKKTRYCYTRYGRKYTCWAIINHCCSIFIDLNLRRLT